MTTSADFPLVHNADNDDAGATPLERHHAAFVVGMAHRASLVLQLRTLDTGAAKDVSGVLRITRGDNSDEDEEQEGDVDVGGEELRMEEKEVLYYIGGDGSAKAFERGSGVGNG